MVLGLLIGGAIGRIRERRAERRERREEAEALQNAQQQAQIPPGFTGVLTRNGELRSSTGQTIRPPQTTAGGSLSQLLQQTGGQSASPFGLSGFGAEAAANPFSGATTGQGTAQLGFRLSGQQHLPWANPEVVLRNAGLVA